MAVDDQRLRGLRRRRPVGTLSPLLVESAASSASTSFSVATNARAAGESSLLRSHVTP
jgi:hypothetical protein